MAYATFAYQMDSESANRLIRQLKLQELRAIAAIGRGGSILAAAELLGSTQPALTRSLAAAEAKLGVKLFDRLPRGVRPTVFGEALLRRIAAIFHEISGAADDIASLQGLSSGTLSIGVMPLGAAGLVPKALQRILAGRPRLRVTVLEGNPEFLLNELRMRRVEIIVGRIALADAESELRKEVLYDEQLSVAAHVTNALHRRPRISLSELADQPWILPPPGTAFFSQVATMFRLAGVAIPTCQITTLSVPLNLGMVAGSDYLSILPRSLISLGAIPPSIRPLSVALPSTRGPVGFILLTAGSETPALNEFISAIRSVAATLASGRERRANSEQQ